jgi:heme exporter protein D
MFDSWEQFFAMGGYARFVWPAYAVTAAAVALTIWAARRSLQQATIEAKRNALDEGEGS